MQLLHGLVWPALIAGLLSGLALSVVQQFTVIPIILEAETYEVGDQNSPNNSASERDLDHSHSEDGHSHAHTHGRGEIWAPDDGTERAFYTFIINVLLGFGYGLLLVVAMTMHRVIRSKASQHSSNTWLNGLWWGLAGYVVFQLAPALGLPPELPGAYAADLEDRQLWWVICVSLTAIGLTYVVFAKLVWFRILGGLILLLPHIIGAPPPPHHGGLAPQELANLFIAVSLLASLLFWIVLGVVGAAASTRLLKDSEIDNLSF